MTFFGKKLIKLLILLLFGERSLIKFEKKASISIYLRKKKSQKKKNQKKKK